MSIESKHGVDEPGYEAPKSRGERLTETGEKMQAAGNAMAALGGALVKLVFFGFLLLVVVLIGISVVSSGGSTSNSTPSVSKTNCEHPSASEPCEGRALEEWHREHGETPLRVQDGEEAPDETEQKNGEAKDNEAERQDEAIREGERLKAEGKTE
jgi:hypothetical protein